MKDLEYYQDLDLKYIELAICLEDSNGDTGKFYIPVLTPTLGSNDAYIDTDNYINKTKILSDTSSMDIGVCTTCNYLILPLPKMTMHLNIPDVFEGDVVTTMTCKKGDKFVVTFIGGDMNKPYLIGRYVDDNEY